MAKTLASEPGNCRFESGLRCQFYRTAPGANMEQQLPRLINAVFTDDGHGRATLTLNGQPAGHQLTDNSYVDDGYRFHDALHLAFAACTGWSPVTRWLLKLPNPPGAGDHGGSISAEEATAAIVYASWHRAQEDGLKWPDQLEILAVSRTALRAGATEMPPETWASAMTQGMQAFTWLHQNKGGTLTADLDAQTLTPHTQRRTMRTSLMHTVAAAEKTCQTPTCVDCGAPSVELKPAGPGRARLPEPLCQTHLDAWLNNPRKTA